MRSKTSAACSAAREDLLESGSVGIDAGPQARELEPSPRLDACVSGQLGLCQRTLQQLADALEIAGSVQRIGELEPQVEPFGRVLRQERARALEEVDSRRSISSGHCAAPRGREQPPAASGEATSRFVHALDLGAVPEGLLEVVAEHLLHLRAPVARGNDEPVREPLVQLRADLLG